MNMVIRYLQLQPETTLPDISTLNPFRAVVIVEEPVTPDWQYKVSSWLVFSGCLYMIAWGNNCSSWHDSVDLANLEAFKFNEIPDNKFVMTSWHENEPLKDVFWFSRYSAFHPTVEISNTLILHISYHQRRQELLAQYKDV